MANSLLKTAAHNSFADAIYSEILSRNSRFYYFVGKTLSWTNESLPPTVVDSRSYERDCRNEIISLKEITPSDVSYVIPRINWTSGVSYDQYDDQYSSEIQGLNLQSGGSIYAVAPTIVIGYTVPLSTNVSVNTQYVYNGLLYTVTAAGTTGSSNTVLLGVQGTRYTHGTVSLTCVGVQATATCVIGTSGTTNQKVISTTLTNKGYGYNTVPNVSFTTGGGTTAYAVAVIATGNNGINKLENTQYYVYSDTNVYVCIDNNKNAISTIAPTGISSGYLDTADGYIWKYMSSVPSNSKFLTIGFLPVFTLSKNAYYANGSIVSVFIDSAGANYLSTSKPLPLSTLVIVGNTYNYNGYAYTATIGGTTSSAYGTPTTTTNASYINGSATFICKGVATTITVTGDGTGAALTPLITNGVLTGVQIDNAGFGYSYINLTVVGSGNGASISSSFSSNATQYTQQSQTEDATINGNICSAQIISGGYGYTNPSVTIVGDGTGALATATVSNGSIVKITFSDRGANYRWADILITDKTGAGASARTVTSPFGGLGKDSINQLGCSTLMFYSKLGNNLNQGLVVTNDYRQIGIIKDPIRYSDGTFLTSNFASPCWKITATGVIDAGILVDDIVTSNVNSISYRFRVVSITGSDILLIPLDNGIPSSGMQFIKSSSIYFIAAYITPPSVDKYSGDLLFIDNESTFVATGVSPAIIRTIINL